MRNRWWAPAGVIALTLLATACGSTSSANPPATGGQPGSVSSSAPANGGSSASALQSRTIGGESVVTNAKGFTLYWFAADTSAKSNCNGSCTTYWPPVPGPVTAGPGVTGKLGTITRADGSVQATYNGHPLYGYVADHAPGQAKGNGLNASGGVWHEVTVSGTAAPAPGQSSSSGGGGYGY